MRIWFPHQYPYCWNEDGHIKIESSDEYGRVVDYEQAQGEDNTEYCEELCNKSFRNYKRGPRNLA